MMRLFLISFLFCFSFNAHAEVIKVTILGSGTPRPSIERFSQSILIEVNKEKLLFDAGRGLSIRLSQMNVGIGEINKVFLTHMHSDHILGLPDLLMTGWIYQRKKPLTVFGPTGTMKFIKNIKNAFVEDIAIRTVAPENHNLDGLETKIFEIEEGLVYQKNHLKVLAFEVDHGGGVKHAFGYKIIYKDQSIIISGDTNYSKNLIKYAKNCDLLIHEIADAPDSLIKKSPKVEGLMNYHTTPSEMIQIINEVKPRYTVLTHVLALGGVSEDQIVKKIKQGLKKEYIVKIAYDLMSIDVKDQIRAYSADYSNER